MEKESVLKFFLVVFLKIFLFIYFDSVLSLELRHA
uniref:Uncharacterized protein n=1 Tax=Anguilla anguilla TaxID=7936 RepID=A0A0E9QYK9_ANGAN